MPFAQTFGTDIYWKLEGAEGAPPLVLLNSIGTDMDLWDAALPRLRGDFRVLRVDTRGHGASRATAGDYSLSQLARDVAAAMGAAGLARATIAGISLGGMIAMQLAVDRPDLADALALICTSPKMDRDAWTARVEMVRSDGMDSILDLAMARFLTPEFSTAHPEIAATIRTGLSQMSAAGYAGCAAAIRDMDLIELLSQIGQRAIIVTGTRDASTPFAGHGAVLMRGLPRAEHIALDCAHLAPIEAPLPLTDAIMALRNG